MYDYCSADHVIHSETVGYKQELCLATVSEDGRHITRMERMRLVSRIIVTFRIGERICLISGAAFSLMDMKCENLRFILLSAVFLTQGCRQSGKFSRHSYAVFHLKKLYASVQLRIPAASFNPC